MIYLKLFINFLIAGCLSFGGYTVISIISEVVKNFDVINEDMIVNFIAISESTPGPIAVNLATYVGTETAGILGAIIATMAIILPAFLIILGYSIFLKKFFNNKSTQFVLSIVRTCVIGIIMAVGLHLLLNSMYLTEIQFSIKSINKNCLLIFFILIFILFGCDKILKKHISSITIIIIAAILGIAINGFM